MRSMTSPSGTTLADLGEFGLVRAITERFEQGEQVLLGPGDDAAVVAVPDGRVVVSTDLHVDTRHFRRDWASAEDIGHRVAAANLSDLNAMGGRATALTVGLAAPPDLLVAWVLELADGIAAEAGLVGASVVGGDLTRADQLMIAVTALGSVEGEPVRRSGARPGDLVAIAGRQGWAAGGLAVLTRGFRSPRALVEAYKRPAPPYAAGAQAAALGATAMIDVSDGLVADVRHVAGASGVAIDVRSAAFEIAEPLQAVGAALGADPLRFILAGGDDHPLVATFPAGAMLPDGWTAIGSVADGSGVTVDGATYDGPGGHTHF
jgi:thiamine-monophosphate kinase